MPQPCLTGLLDERSQIAALFETLGVECISYAELSSTLGAQIARKVFQEDQAKRSGSYKWRVGTASVHRSFTQRELRLYFESECQKAICNSTMTEVKFLQVAAGMLKGAVGRLCHKT